MALQGRSLNCWKCLQLSPPQDEPQLHVIMVFCGQITSDDGWGRYKGQSTSGYHRTTVTAQCWNGHGFSWGWEACIRVGHLPLSYLAPFLSLPWMWTPKETLKDALHSNLISESSSQRTHPETVFETYKMMTHKSEEFEYNHFFGSPVHTHSYSESFPLISEVTTFWAGSYICHALAFLCGLNSHLCICKQDVWFWIVFEMYIHGMSLSLYSSSCFWFQGIWNVKG